ncbi:hypothetical protein D6779_09805 [Candidatus Parcubacteria bacterium]|nr:MAG: hypothetical protein D6779_09805 [Candidatus Parcubacteria bacterium]
MSDNSFDISELKRKDNRARQRAYANRQRRMGRKKVTIWLTEEEKTEVINFIKKKRYEEENPYDEFLYTFRSEDYKWD